MTQTRPCWVEIHTRSFEENYRFLTGLAAPDVELLAVVKADAYGHGLALCAPAAMRAGARWLGVTSVEEGVAARAACPAARVLVIGGVYPGQGVDLVRHQLTPVVWDPVQIDELESAVRSVGDKALSVHLEIDTGMSRQGVDSQGLTQILQRFGHDSPLRLEGVMTHLFAADEADGRVTDDQLRRTGDFINQIEAAGIHADLLNVGNSAALLAGQAPVIAALAARHEMKALMRPGLALYGIASSYYPPFASAPPPSLLESNRKLKPVLSWKSQVTSVRSVPTGTVVGYNGTFVAIEPMRLALIAVGYADGLDRRLGNRFSLLVRGNKAPLIGRVSMDQAVLDVTDIPDVCAGDDVIILGQQDGERISVFDHAEAAGTIPWEIFTRIGSRVRRVETQ